jgi:hypothetical protein
VIYYDEPDKRTFYKKEEGKVYGSVITDTVIDAPCQQVMGCYDNLPVLNKLMPEFYDLEWKKKITDVKGIIYGKQVFPWPLAHRDMLFTVTGNADYKNHAFFSVSKSVDVGEEYYGYVVEGPPENSGLVRLDILMGYNYF